MNQADCLAIYEDAEFYEMEFASRSFELPFFREYAQEWGDPILEVACGTGRLTLPLARDGHDVTGLDISPQMLALARRKSAAAGLSIEWLEQDCVAMSPGRQFAYIFSATNAMQHLLTIEAACGFLQSARRALRPEGHLILDIFNPGIARLLRPESERYLHKTITPPGGEVISVETTSSYDAATQILHFDLFYLCQGILLRTKRVDMRCFFPQEILALCRLNGFEVVHCFGNYDRSELRSDSPKQLLVLRPSLNV